MNDLKFDWPKIVKDIRSFYGWTQIELGRMLEVTGMSVSNWESGRATPTRFPAAVLRTVFFYIGASPKKAKFIKQSMACLLPDQVGILPTLHIVFSDRSRKMVYPKFPLKKATGK